MTAAVENVEGAKQVDGNQIDVLVAVLNPTECVTTGAFLMQAVKKCTMMLRIEHDRLYSFF